MLKYIRLSFDNAVLDQERAKLLAQFLEMRGFISPINCSLSNLRKECIVESLSRMELLIQRMNSNENMNWEHALGTIRFFSELYNVGFIYDNILKKFVDFLDEQQSQRLVSYKCFHLLIETVGATILSKENNHTSELKSLREMVIRVESKVSSSSMKQFSAKNPQLDFFVSGYPTLAKKESANSIYISEFKSILHQLSKEN